MRKRIGIILTVLCILLCIIPMIPGENSEKKFRSSKPKHWPMERIRTEKNGSVRINNADEEELIQLPGIGETISGLIVSERSINGPYYYAEDLESVRGIGPRTLENIRNMIDMSQDESEE